MFTCDGTKQKSFCGLIRKKHKPCIESVTTYANDPTLVWNRIISIALAIAMHSVALNSVAFKGKEHLKYYRVGQDNSTIMLTLFICSLSILWLSESTLYKLADLSYVQATKNS